MNFNLKISKETKVGITVLLAIAIFYFGINYLKGINLFSPSKSYFARFENADMLLASAPVTLNGLQVGVVEDIFFPEGNSKIVLVRLRIAEDELKIPIDSKAHIKSDLLGVRTMYLEIGKSTEMLTKGDTLAGKLDSAFTDKLTTTINPLKNKVESLVVSIDSVLTTIRGLFSKKTQKDLTITFESIAKTSVKLDHAMSSMDDLISSEKDKISDISSNLKSISENIRKNNEKLSNIFSNIDRISDDLAKSNVKQTMSDLQKSISSLSKIMNRIESGEGTLGKIISSDELYNNLQKSSKSLNELLIDMKANPERYIQISVFGKKDKKSNK